MARRRFRADSLYAARCWAAHNRGSSSIDAQVAGEQWHLLVLTLMAWSKAWIKVHQKRNG